MIFNAHIDPIWLWPWQSGLDEVLATCRSACDLLDDYPDLIFTRAEAWAYKQVERLDPALFGRIKKRVESGRWEIAGGWWIQPDCNQPSGFGFERQIGLGKEYLEDRFGFFPKVAYNVDSFGHAATLPGYMRAAGQEFYVMMRPQEHEMALPARVFRWRGYEDGPEVTVFRIAGGYCTGGISLDHVCNSLRELPKGIEHTMCFVGVGDHGGGPSAAMIEWCLENRDAIEGCRIVISSPSRFFQAISEQIPGLPLVTGELQHHAIGCYTVQRPVKEGVRRAEHRLRQAELSAGSTPEIKEAWERVCLHQFHDTLGGTCLPSAYPAVLAQLGYAQAVADETLQYHLRERMGELPDDSMQRIVLLNASDSDFRGYTEFEPWLDWQHWRPDWRLADEQGTPVPFQVMRCEAAHNVPGRLLFKADIPAGEMRVLRIERGAAPQPSTPGVRPAVSGFGPAALGFGSGTAEVRLDMIEDRTDNWSHGVDRYPDGPITAAVWNPPFAVDDGPLMSSWIQTGSIGDSPLRAEWRVYAGEPFVELRLQVHWIEKRRLLKLTVQTPDCARRIDGIPGGSLERANDGKERPLRDWSLFRSGELHMGIVCPEVYALEANPARARFTLLRSPIATHHDPWNTPDPREVFTDQGVHEFRFRFFGNEATPELLELQALMLHRPLIAGDLTRGMPRVRG